MEESNAVELVQTERVERDWAKRDDFCNCDKPFGVYGKFGRHHRISESYPEHTAQDLVVGPCPKWHEVREGEVKAKVAVQVAKNAMQQAQRDRDDHAYFRASNQYDTARDELRGWQQELQRLKGDDRIHGEAQLWKAP